MVLGANIFLRNHERQANDFDHWRKMLWHLLLVKIIQICALTQRYCLYFRLKSEQYSFQNAIGREYSNIFLATAPRLGLLPDF